MKTFLKYLPYWIIGAVSFTVITLMDLVWILMALCIKAMRLLFSWLLGAFDPDNDTNDTYNGVNTFGNLMVNNGYKFYIDLMYPTEEDFEDEEDEDDSLYDDDED